MKLENYKTNTILRQENNFINILEEMYPVGSIYCVGGFIANNIKSAKKMLPKFGEWEYIGIFGWIAFAFKRIK